MEGPLTRHRARVVWEGSKDDLRAHRVELGGQAIAASCSPEWGGDPGKADPEEMFVGGLSSCHMLWFLALARQRRLRIVAYEDAALGTLDGMRITAVELHPEVQLESDPGPAVLAELHLAAHQRCFLANSVNFPVEVVVEGVAP
ncbi:MAG: OsmC family protein [Thermoleophilia bacterium]|nr:OsmC family protein [Thermoleophilia bacterium]